MKRSEIQGSARQRQSPPVSVSVPHLCLSSPDSALLHLGYVVASLHSSSVDTALPVCSCWHQAVCSRMNWPMRSIACCPSGKMGAKSCQTWII